MIAMYNVKGFAHSFSLLSLHSFAFEGFISRIVFSLVGLAAFNAAVSWYSLQQAAKIWPQVTFMQIYDSFSNGFHPPKKTLKN